MDLVGREVWNLLLFLLSVKGGGMGKTNHSKLIEKENE